MYEISTMKKKDVRIVYTRVIKDIYEGASTNVRTQDVAIDDFSITIRLYQGSTITHNTLTSCFNKFRITF
ncbi:hypothetical protein MTR_1g101470 [Medicago truncatula]|uniref:Uncharacterized protein n=1 Tax=Medicago truncatula TaxID=3880 RepID=G7IAQ9_MEDTR|nr:hypothetical protein MTR_1g101470 [Medicago truncatula]